MVDSYSKLLLMQITISIRVTEILIADKYNFAISFKKVFKKIKNKKKKKKKKRVHRFPAFSEKALKIFYKENKTNVTTEKFSKKCRLKHKILVNSNC